MMLMWILVATVPVVIYITCFKEYNYFKQLEKRCK